MAKLNNCYKCGAKVKIVLDKIYDEYHIECTNCGISYGLGFDGKNYRSCFSKDEIVDAWNNFTGGNDAGNGVRKFRILPALPFFIDTAKLGKNRR